MLKILHTADLQLDAPFSSLGYKGAQHRQQLRKTFTRIVQVAKGGDYHLLLIAGDLFNSNRPSQNTIDLVHRELDSLTIPVVIVPGNHDNLGQNSVYRRQSFSTNVHILTRQPTFLDFPDLDLTIAGRPLISSDDRDSPLKGIKRQGDRRWFVVIAHGNLQVGRIANVERPIQPQEIAECGADYVALGDWHRFADYTQNTVTAFYCGAPEPTAFNQDGAGFVASVTFSETGVLVEPIRVGRIKARQIELNVSGLSANEVVSRIRREANTNLMLDIRLTGIKAVELVIDIEAIETLLADAFYCLRVIDLAHPSITSIAHTEYPQTLVIGQYVHILSDLINKAKDDRKRRIAEEALQVGIALLQGKDVLR